MEGGCQEKWNLKARSLTAKASLFSPFYWSKQVRRSAQFQEIGENPPHAVRSGTYCERGRGFWRLSTSAHTLAPTHTLSRCRVPLPVPKSSKILAHYNIKVRFKVCLLIISRQKNPMGFASPPPTVHPMSDKTR